MKHDKISTKIAKAGTPLKHHDAEQKNRYSSGLEDNLKKALTELLILFLFGEEEHYIGELSPLLEKRSHGDSVSSFLTLPSIESPNPAT